MDADAARDFIRKNHHAVLATYRAAMERERRVLLRISVDRVGPNQSG